MKGVLEQAEGELVGAEGIALLDALRESYPELGGLVFRMWLLPLAQLFEAHEEAHRRVRAEGVAVVRDGVRVPHPALGTIERTRRRAAEIAALVGLDVGRCAVLEGFLRSGREAVLAGG